jgi:hypothetical protein
MASLFLPEGVMAAVANASSPKKKPFASVWLQEGVKGQCRMINYDYRTLTL